MQEQCWLIDIFKQTSMLVYLTAILCSTLVGRFAERQQASSKRRAALAVIACIPLCLVAGFRAISVGVDTQNYPYMIFNYSQVYPLEVTFVRFIPDVEPLYIVVVWVIGAVTGSYNAVLFFSQLLTVLPIVVYLLVKYPEQISMGIFLYGTLIFGFTLNIVRQSIAFAWILLIALVPETASRTKRALYVCCTVLAAASVHLTALLGAVIYISAREFARAHCELGIKRLVMITSIGASVLLVVAYLASDWILTDLLPNIKRSYAAQMDYMGRSKGKELLICAAHCVMVVVISKQYRAEAKDAGKEDVASMLGSALILLTAFYISMATLITPEVYRISFSLFTFTIPLYLEYRRGLSGSARNRLTASMVMHGIAFFIAAYWVLGIASIVPYEIQIY